MDAVVLSKLRALILTDFTLVPYAVTPNSSTPSWHNAPRPYTDYLHVWQVLQPG